MASRNPEFRQAPGGSYRVIEIDSSKQRWFGDRGPEEVDYTVIIGTFDDWDEAVAALGALTHRHCRRQMWSERGCVGENNHGEIWTFDPFR